MVYEKGLRLKQKRLGLIFTFPVPPAKQSAVIRRGRMHRSRRATPEILDRFGKRVDQPAWGAENQQQQREIHQR
jgi:hypothetical protein